MYTTSIASLQARDGEYLIDDCQLKMNKAFLLKIKGLLLILYLPEPETAVHNFNNIFDINSIVFVLWMYDALLIDDICSHFEMVMIQSN